MSWGQARRPKISNKLGFPSPREGSDGDIQVRQTGVGARLFAKLGGRWLSNVLSDESKFPVGEIFTPRVWVFNGTFDSTPSDLSIDLPTFIHSDNVLYVGFGVEYRGTAYGFQFAKLGGQPAEYDGSSDFFEQIAVEVALRGNSITLLTNSSATSLVDEKFILTVFFK